jgi:hypothetical protein
MKKRRSITAAELMAKLEADPNYRRSKAERDRAFALRAAKLKTDERPLVEELRAAGFDIHSVWDFVNDSNRYPGAIPILLRHLSYDYSDPIREGIARALATRDARAAWPILAEEYRNTKTGSQFKSGLAVALSAIASRDTLQELIGLITDPAHGSSRLLLLSALRRSRDPSAKQLISELATNLDFAKEIGSWLKR